MQTKIFRYLLAVPVFMLAGLVACRKEDNLDKELIMGDTWAKTELDNWLLETFTKPYNIEVKYRWDATESDLSYTMVPPSLDKVRPIMEVVKQAWIDVYAAEAGEAFVKQLAPKQYMLVGSLRYNATTVTLGEAEGGNKVVLLGVDAFKKTDRDMVKRVLKTIHHEFTHILNQKTMFPIEFKKVTPGLYTGTWNQVALADARSQGFITSYAMADPMEDFAEMTSIMITEGKAGFDAIVNAQSGAAQLLLRLKEDMVATYFKQVWNIDIYSLQARVQTAINDISPVNMGTLLGFGKTYTSILTTPAGIDTLSAAFKTAYTTAKNNLYTNASGRTLDAVYLQFFKADSASLRVTYINASNVTYQSYFGYGAAYDNAGNVTLTFKGNLTNTNSNSNTVGPYITALTSYFNGQYKMDWKNGKMTTVAPYLGGIYKVSDPASYFVGVLGN